MPAAKNRSFEYLCSDTIDIKKKQTKQKQSLKTNMPNCEDQGILVGKHRAAKLTKKFFLLKLVKYQNGKKRF